MSSRPYRTRDQVANSDLPPAEAMLQHPSIEMLAPAQLKPYPRNARTHSKKQIRQIARSIERFGFTNPVLIDEGDQIIAGHGRVAAALQIGLGRVPVLRIGHLSAVDKRAYILADNRLAERAGWDREVLALELGELCELLTDEIDITGFETGEVDLLLSDLDDTPDPADEVPALPRLRPRPARAISGALGLIASSAATPATAPSTPALWPASAPRWCSRIPRTTCRSRVMCSAAALAIASSPSPPAR